MSEYLLEDGIIIVVVIIQLWEDQINLSGVSVLRGVANSILYKFFIVSIDVL